MTKAEEKAKLEAEEKITLSCRYGKNMPGDVIRVKKDEAARLKALGVAK